MKTIIRTARHRAEVHENGRVIDRATGRQAILAMRERHGLMPAKKQQPLKPDGLEHQANDL